MGDHLKLNDDISINSPTLSRDNHQITLFETCLPIEYQSNHLTNKIRRSRILALIALTIQVIGTIGGFYCYFAQERQLYLLANLFSSLISAFGIFGILRLNKFNLLIHAIMTSGIFGLVFVYIIVEVATNKNASVKYTKNGFNEKTLSIIYSLPYFIDSLVGIFSLNLVYNLLNEEEQRLKIHNENNRKKSPKRKKFTQSECFSIQRTTIFTDTQSNYEPNQAQCIICMVESSNVLVLPCEHLIFCTGCAEKYTANHQACPACNKEISDFAIVT